MRKQLLIVEDAVVTKKQHRKPCSDCPWARKALKGWLGLSTIEEWIAAAHGESQIDCHNKIPHQCAGAAIYRANVIKECRDPKLLRLPANRELVFSWPDEFRKHHTRE